MCHCTCDNDCIPLATNQNIKHDFMWHVVRDYKHRLRKTK